MTYTELLKAAREKFGLTVKGRPKKAEIEALVAKASQERAQATDPQELRANAAALREMGEQVTAEAAACEERAGAIEKAQVEVKSTTFALLNALVAFLAAVRKLVALGFEYEFPEPLTAEGIERLIEKMTPPVPPPPPPPQNRLYVFWVDGAERAGRAYVLATSFQLAKDAYLARRVSYGECWPQSCSWPTEAKAAHAALQENGTWTSDRYRATVHTQTLESEHIYRFRLSGSEYAGEAVVVARDFVEAKAKALAGDNIEGDRPEMDAEDLAELGKALDALTENGRTERAGHTLTTQTLV